MQAKENKQRKVVPVRLHTYEKAKVANMLNKEYPGIKFGTALRAFLLKISN